MTNLKHDKIKYEIASPCDQEWNDMDGDDKCRFCSLCEKSVYNLSSMSKNEVSNLLNKGQDICTRVFQRPDGTILTEDCPVGLSQVKSHLKERKFLAASLCLLTLVFSNFTMAKERRKLMGKIAPRPVVEKPIEKDLETVGPEENWDYKNKEVIQEKDEHIMGFLTPVEPE